MKERRIQVRSVAYIPAAQVQNIPEPAIVVSIKGKYDTRPEIGEQHRVHHLNFDIGDWTSPEDRLTGAQLTALFQFLESCPKELPIYFHCTEGHCRSYTMAKVLVQSDMLKYDLDDDNPLAAPSGQFLDRTTCATFNGWLSAVRVAQQALGKA